MALHCCVVLIDRALPPECHDAGCACVAPRACQFETGAGPDPADKAGGVHAAGGSGRAAPTDCELCLSAASASLLPTAVSRDSRDAWGASRLIMSEQKGQRNEAQHIGSCMKHMAPGDESGNPA